MVNGQFEVELLGAPSNVLGGTIAAEAREPGELPTRIFDIHDLVEVQIDWSLTGVLQHMVCGTWDVDVFLESIGPGNELELDSPDNPIPLDPAGSGHYSTTVKIPADTIQPAGDETDIAYKIVATVTYKDLRGKPGPMAGFVELPMVQFYKDA